MPTPEVPVPLVQEHPEEFQPTEHIQTTGVQATPATPKPLYDNTGQPLISTPSSTSAKIQLQSDTSSLLKKAKGSITDAATWLARFLLRALALKKINANNNQ